MSGQERAAGAYDPQADGTNRLPTAKNLPYRDMDALNTAFGRRGRLPMLRSDLCTAGSAVDDPELVGRNPVIGQNGVQCITSSVVSAWGKLSIGALPEPSSVRFSADPTRANLLGYTEVPAQNRRSAIALQCRQPAGSFDLTRPVKPHKRRRCRDDTPQQSPRKPRAAVDG